MFFDKITEDEFFSNVQKNLYKLQTESEARDKSYRDKIANNLQAAADILNNVGFVKEANVIIKVCECINDPATKGLSSEEMLNNLEQKGIPLRLTDKSKTDDNDEVIIDQD